MVMQIEKQFWFHAMLKFLWNCTINTNDPRVVPDIGVRDGGGRGGSCPPQKITKSKSRANVQHKSGKKWEIKKRKSPQFVGQTKAVGQYSLNSWEILADCSFGKIFGPLKWYTDQNVFGDGGGGGRRN